MWSTKSVHKTHTLKKESHEIMWKDTQKRKQMLKSLRKKWLWTRAEDCAPLRYTQRRQLCAHFSGTFRVLLFVWPCDNWTLGQVKGENKKRGHILTRKALWGGNNGKSNTFPMVNTEERKANEMGTKRWTSLCEHILPLFFLCVH